MYNSKNEKSKVKNEVIAKWRNVDHIAEMIEWMGHDWFHIRAIDCRAEYQKGTHVGYFDLVNLEDAISHIEKAKDLHAIGIYININPFCEGCEAVSFRKMKKSYSGDAIGKAQVTRIRHIMVDVDPVRSNGMKVMATDDERENAKEVFDIIARFLIKNGIDDYLSVDSGSGYQMQIKCDIDIEHEDLIKIFLNGLANKFDNDLASVDTSTYDLPRVCRLAGTLNAKADSTETRPHRISKIIGITKNPNVLELDDLKCLIDQLGPKEPKTDTPDNKEPPKVNNNDSADHLINWLTERNIEYVQKGKELKYGVECPFCGNPKENHGSSVMINEHGAFVYKCFHQTAADCATTKNWKEYSEHYEIPIDDIVAKTVEPYEVPQAEEKVEPEPEPETKPEPEKTNSKSVLLTYKQLRAIAAEENFEWIWEDWIRMGSTHLLTGLSFSGKSCVVAELIAAMAENTHFCNRAVKRVPVILFDMENEASIIVERIEQATNKIDELDKFLFPIDRRVMPTPLFKKDHINLNLLDQLINLVATHKTKERGLLIIDTFRTLSAGSGLQENSNDDMSAMFAKVKEISTKTGWAVLVLHHNNKHANSAAGANAIESIADFSHNWQREPLATKAKLHWKGRGKRQLTLEFQFNDETQRNEYLGTANEVKKTTEYEEHDYILEHVTSKPQTLTDILKAVNHNRKNKQEITKKTVRTTLKSMTEDGFIHCDTTGKAHLFSKWS